MNKIYAGIGSRETLQDVLVAMEAIGRALGKKGFLLRSGGADEADQAFQRGCESVNGRKEIYLPWNGYNEMYKGGDFKVIPVTLTLERIAQEYHPAWHRLSGGGIKLMCRNVNIMMGEDTKYPIFPAFVVCWTKDGLASGGTGQAIRLAEAYKIKVYNLRRKADIDDLAELISEL
jgi:hypothetical protein